MSWRVPLFAILAGSLLWASPLPSLAASFDADGFVQSDTAARIVEADCPPGTACPVPTAEFRGQVKLHGATSDGTNSVTGRAELIQDFVFNETRADLRELYWDWTSHNATVRTGRQVITWGVGDLLFINDTFPKDFNGFFSGLPLEYLKRSSDALNLTTYLGPATIETVVSRFRADNSPEARRFVFAHPLPPLPVVTDEPTGSDQLELSAKMSGTIGSWEPAAYVSHTHWHSPAFRIQPNQVEAIFPSLNTYGVSLTGPEFDGVVSFEAAYYDSVGNRAGRDPAIENSQLRALIGYSRQLWQDDTVEAQWYAEQIYNYGNYVATLPPGVTRRPRLRQVATTSWTQLLWNQTLALNLFAFWGLSEHDRYLVPSVHYAFTDSLWGEVGFNIFQGSSRGSFGSLKADSNMYVTLRYVF